MTPFAVAFQPQPHQRRLGRAGPSESPRRLSAEPPSRPADCQEQWGPGESPGQVAAPPPFIRLPVTVVLRRPHTCQQTLTRSSHGQRLPTRFCPDAAFPLSPAPPGTARPPESGRSSVTTRGPLPLLGVCGFSTSGTGATQDGSAPLEQRASAAPTRGPRGPRRAVGAGRGPRTRASAGPASPEASVLGVQVAGGNFGTLICGVRSIA